MSGYLFSSNTNNNPNKKIKKFIFSSFVFHIVAIALILTLGTFFNLRPKIKFKSIQARLVKLGKQRDKRLLPRIVKKDVAIAPKIKKHSKGNSIKKKKIVKKKKHKKIKIKKKKQQKVEDLNSLLSGINQKLKKDARAEKSNEGMANGSKDGDVTDPTLAIKGNIYIRRLSAIIKSNWKIPSILNKNEIKSLVSEVFFRITFSGEVYNISIITTSGNKIFDSSVLEAIKRTGKLPLPKDRGLRKMVLREGLQWKFSPSL